MMYIKIIVGIIYHITSSTLYIILYTHGCAINVVVYMHMAVYSWYNNIHNYIIILILFL